MSIYIDLQISSLYVIHFLEIVCYFVFNVKISLINVLYHFTKSLCV